MLYFKIQAQKQRHRLAILFRLNICKTLSWVIRLFDYFEVLTNYHSAFIHGEMILLSPERARYNSDGQRPSAWNSIFSSPVRALYCTIFLRSHQMRPLFLHIIFTMCKLRAKRLSTSKQYLNFVLAKAHKMEEMDRIGFKINDVQTAAAPQKIEKIFRNVRRSKTPSLAAPTVGEPVPPIWREVWGRLPLFFSENVRRPKTRRWRSPGKFFFALP